MDDIATSMHDSGGLAAPMRWTAAHVAAISRQAAGYAPLIAEPDVKLVCELGIWDAWPIEHPHGQPAVLSNGDTLWMALAAPRTPDPDQRHANARIHLFVRSGPDWRHLGPAMPDGFSPGSREWSGSAIIDPDGKTVTLYFTAAGRKGEPRLTFEQRLFSARATLQSDGSHRLMDWRDLRPMIERDPDYYMTTAGGDGRPGSIKAFRDPFHFADPADGRRYVFFTGSDARSRSSYNGVVGVAIGVRGTENWTLMPPLISADGLNNELERPHIIVRDGLYYLFWSTQAHVFDPAGPVGPTGLYGMVAPSLSGPWSPLNRTGLVIANPPEAPQQAYGWLVLPDLTVASFVDDWGADRSSMRRFGGTFAPFLRLRVDGADAAIDPR